jgi:hypothetical protein
MSLYTAIVIPLAFISGIWIPTTLLCCSPWVQKQYVPNQAPANDFANILKQDVVSALGNILAGEMAYRARESWLSKCV